MNKRAFLKNMTLASLSVPGILKNLDKWMNEIDHSSPIVLAENEDFWAKVRSQYRLKPDYINLENGYYCFVPQETLEHLIQHVREVNYQASYYMRTVQWKNKETMASRLAGILGADSNEVIITRNTTESLDTVIHGIHWQTGDEAVMATHDYGAMLNQFKLVERRFGVVNNIIEVPMHPSSDSEIVEAYANAITPKTKLLMACHMINITGHILPIRKICDMAHSKGVEVMVDGAHSFAHVTFDVKDLDCDYFGTSLHKWLSVPLGAGLLYIKKDKVKNLWPLFDDGDKPLDSISRLNHTGTHPVHTDLAIGNAIDYYMTLGPERKEARMRFLQNYWTDKIRDIPNIVLNTPKERNRSCGIANVGIKGVSPHDLAKNLLEKYRIWTVAISGRGVEGCRITPNVYTSTKELDVFVEALKEMSAS